MKCIINCNKFQIQCAQCQLKLEDISQPVVTTGREMFNKSNHLMEDFLFFLLCNGVITMITLLGKQRYTKIAGT